ncbi:similar to Saccharomyces cerevisiae YLR008C PAM18 Constituent of the import motor (PAM complex) component of the Translocase of the Inner Mitochondrial membrane (TIM23 complex) [Maudiozyma barnettii]|uniref:Mitochondrial import inner membrane translocase subunit TIM14 n=1 Tax=Maudiozyma barnettii TaxID=61262 RepID=A0A8H2VBA9_9SACH|nr:Pam18p [Kazachstania barnettii]CAB4252120.1 similar to Saccharomyces cerevisiae YLR008C PAM18 Constituent of the import motor (PAM complex) component of the Translocase of the Inner Mitochondrial membrane (TIM23 complex) [Kazachstania barnettii]CAD1778657.1 similar to Saccharomyces cerevisiae YLR008C PAM18 Constituent of the import motor (PAM complex) component of the Translocase of the Inner Mitochondrial membrane (TIM23 complex) [Kazachstania barnettii]
MSTPQNAAPQLPIPGENNLAADASAGAIPIGNSQVTPMIPSQKSGMDLYFDNALSYMGEHPVLTGVGAFFALYATAGIYKTVQTKMNGGKSVATYLKGGFDPKMNKKEALQILNLTENNLSKKKLKEVHRKIMLANHPDKGGSPYLATKINEAKDFIQKKGSLSK